MSSYPCTLAAEIRDIEFVLTDNISNKLFDVCIGME